MKSKNPKPKLVLFDSFLKTWMEFDLIKTPRRRIANLKDYLKSSLPSGNFSTDKLLIFYKHIFYGICFAVNKIIQMSVNILIGQFEKNQ